jgi:predicted dehydrogenase
MKAAINRRRFLETSATAGAGLLILPNSRTAFAYEANNKLRVAGIGTGGQGRSDLDNIANCDAEIVALCDVDHARAGDIFQKHPRARAFKDFRKMLEAMDKEIDAVLVATPDHTHAVAAVAAMKHGKHVYCEKPLTRTVHEARVMRETAAKHKVVTQMGNQGSAENGLRRAVELVWQGTIGEVREAHLWFDGGNGPQKRPMDRVEIPATLEWDLWLGPAEERPYNPCYLPASWRSWRAFGSGIVGDFGCHTGNLMFRALKLQELWNLPSGKSSKTIIRIKTNPSERDAEGYPSSLVSTVELPARGELPPVTLHVYAKEKPSEDLMLGHPRGAWGDLLVGSRGSIYSDNPWNTTFVLLPKDKFLSVKAGPPQTIPAGHGHHREWVEACKGNGKTFSPFAIGGPLTELMQLVNASTLIEGPIEYDVHAGKIVNSSKANDLMHRQYRKGWVL